MYREDAARRLATDAAAGRRYDLVLVDPPYRMLSKFQPMLATHLPSVVAPDGLVVVESEAKEEPELPLPLRTSRRYGSTRVSLFEGYAVSDSSPVTAICPGSYDPVTNGHLDIITRAAGIFERVVVGVVRDPQHKKAMFSVEERVQFLRDALADHDNIEVEVFAELVVEFARAWGAKTMVKGLRAISDFEWEFQMHHLNRNLAPEVETMYLMSSPQYSFLSSSGVKEVASFGGDVRDLVPEPVAKRFREMFPRPKGGAPVSPQE